MVILRRATPGADKTAVAALAVATLAGLCVSWLLVCTLGDNSDLGLRAVLPAALILIGRARRD